MAQSVPDTGTSTDPTKQWSGTVDPVCSFAGCGGLPVIALNSTAGRPTTVLEAAR